MIEWVVVLLVIVCIIAWYYSHSLSEYRFSQIKEVQIPTQLDSLWEEKIPIIVSDLNNKDIWTSDSLKLTKFWTAQPVWAMYEQDAHINTRTSKETSILWADILGITQIQQETLVQWFSLSPLVFSVTSETHLGPIPLRPTFGWATCIKCTQGEARCILLHNAQKSRLPAGWESLRWRDATVAHHPIWSQVKFVEVILRPGTALLIPPHWVMALEPLDTEKPMWSIISEVHHPVSKIAKRIHENNIK
jgi:hypothetical protein